MKDEIVECPELTGKVIRRLSLYQANVGEQEIMIDFTDGTSFSCAFEAHTSTKASLIRTGIGTPETLTVFLD
jgi:hypothetical protein